MNKSGFDWLTVALILLIFVIGNLVFGPLAILFMGVAVYHFARNVWRCWNSRNLIASVIYVSLFVAVLVGFFLEIWAEHPGFGYDEKGERIIERHKHYIWEFDHIH